MKGCRRRQVFGESHMLPLAGLRVVDLTRVLAGPFCAMLLGDMGADVIKVEEPSRRRRAGVGAVCRRRLERLLPRRQPQQARLALDLKSAEGAEVLRRLSRRRRAHRELQAGQPRQAGLRFEETRRLNPRLVYCSISGYGKNGPRRHSPDTTRWCRPSPASWTSPARPTGRRCASALR